MQGYGPRTYRLWTEGGDLVSFQISLKESDLYIRANRSLEKEAFDSLAKYRGLVEGYAMRHPDFLSALRPLELEEDAPEIVRSMGEAAHSAGVGPMAAVAGAIAEAVGKEIMSFTDEVIVENGGDIFLSSSRKREIGIYAGDDSPFTGNLALEIDPEHTPIGVCASSGTVGHSLSFGQCDASIVLSPSTALADATATALGNLVIDESDITAAIDFGKNIPGIEGLVIIKGDHIGAWGSVKLVSLQRSES